MEIICIYKNKIFDTACSYMQEENSLCTYIGEKKTENENYEFSAKIRSIFYLPKVLKFLLKQKGLVELKCRIEIKLLSKF